ncbi:unnamed protein product [Owenia fusiformis]|uniref:WSC domain-containing protein n=1 Tax=Owenia fusiformis TaxID=6347 RepID=A0A8S4PUT5_OWEFU|nr:unnamed protein product [Owenia fusiformis]
MFFNIRENLVRQMKNILILISALHVTNGQAVSTSGQLFAYHGDFRGAIPFDSLEASSVNVCATFCASKSNQCTCFSYNTLKECRLLESAIDGAVIAVPDLEYVLYCNTDVDIYVHNYIGCYGDTGDRDLPYNTNKPPYLTPQVCIDTCRNLNQGFLYAAVQFGTDCFCGTSYGKYGPSTSCTYTCEGDPQQTCGGFNGNEIYAI